MNLIQHGTNGKDWQQATEQEKREFCRVQEKAHWKLSEGQNEDFYYEALSAMFAEDASVP